MSVCRLYHSLYPTVVFGREHNISVMSSVVPNRNLLFYFTFGQDNNTFVLSCRISSHKLLFNVVLSHEQNTIQEVFLA